MSQYRGRLYVKVIVDDVIFPFTFLGEFLQIVDQTRDVLNTIDFSLCEYRDTHRFSLLITFLCSSDFSCNELYLLPDFTLFFDLSAGDSGSILPSYLFFTIISAFNQSAISCP